MRYYIVLLLHESASTDGGCLSRAHNAASGVLEAKRGISEIVDVLVRDD